MEQSGEIATVPLIGTIYEAALDATKWPSFLAGFATLFRSEQALMWAHDFGDKSAELSGGPSSMACTVGIDDYYLNGYVQHFCSCNVWLENEHLHREGQIVDSSELSSERQLLSSEWYGDWLRSQGLQYSFAAVVEKRNRRSFNVTAVRTRGRGPYTPLESQQLRSLMPHLQTAFALHRRLHRAEALAQASMDLLDRLPLGIVLLGDKAEVLYANARAHALAQDTGLVRIGRGIQSDDELHALNHSDDLPLQQAMRQVVSTGKGLPLHAGKGIRLHGLKADLHALVAPLPQNSQPFGSGAAGVVFLSNPAATLNQLDAILRMTYRLTMAESLLTQALVNGQSLNEYAQQQLLSVHTVRGQLKSVTSKVGVSRQSDLVRTILNGPAMFRWGEALSIDR